MSITATAPGDARALALPRRLVELPADPRAKSSPPSVWHRISFWPLEFVRLVAVVYALPLAILAIGIPVGLALTGLFLGATWVWRMLW
jgi:anti-sigma-K factor RskA